METKQRTFTEPTKEGIYTIKVIPTNKRTWREANELEVAFTLDVGNETRTFKGLLDLYGIIKKGG